MCAAEFGRSRCVGVEGRVVPIAPAGVKHERLSRFHVAFAAEYANGYLMQVASWIERTYRYKRVAEAPRRSSAQIGRPEASMCVVLGGACTQPVDELASVDRSIAI